MSVWILLDDCVHIKRFQMYNVSNRAEPILFRIIFLWLLLVFLG